MSAMIASLALAWIAYGFNQTNQPFRNVHVVVTGGLVEGQPIDVTLNSGLGGFELTH